MIFILVSILMIDIIKKVNYFVYCVVFFEKLLQQYLLFLLFLKYEKYDDCYYMRCKYIFEKLFIKFR